jgi:hypothetical protein
MFLREDLGGYPGQETGNGIQLPSMVEFVLVSVVQEQPPAYPLMPRIVVAKTSEMVCWGGR